MIEFDIWWIGDLVGLLGVALYLASYALLQTGRISADAATYPLLNIAAAACVLVDLSSSFNLPSALIQMSWIVISLCGLWRVARKFERPRAADVSPVIHLHDIVETDDTVPQPAAFRHAWDDRRPAGASPL